MEATNQIIFHNKEQIIDMYKIIKGHHKIKMFKLVCKISLKIIIITNKEINKIKNNK
jgi:hypothetical protein